MKTVGLVILNWNGETLLKRFLPNVIKHSPQAHIYIADNASTDGSEAWVKTNHPEVTWIGLDQNYGYAGGYNRALKKVQEPILALVNSDVAVSENWLDPILGIFDTQTQTAIIQPKILDEKAPGYFEYAGAGGGFIDALGYPYCRGRVFESIEQDYGQFDDITQIFWASGACFLIRNSVFEKLEGFDERFFAHQEEIDLCWRAFNAGYDTYYCGKSSIYHLGGATLSSQSPQKTYLNFRNSLWMLTKNLPIGYVIPILLSRLILDVIAGLRFLLQGKIPHLLAILRAHFSFYRGLLVYIKKRKSPQKKSYFKTFSIVWDYYVKRNAKALN